MKTSSSIMKVVYIRSRRDGHPALSCHPNEIKASTYGEAYEWETWTLYENVDKENPHMVALQAYTGKFLSAQPCGSVAADRDEVLDWEKWTIVPSTDGFAALRSHHGKYLVCDDFFNPGASVRADRDEIHEWEEWAIVDCPRAMMGSDPGKKVLGGLLTTLGALATVGGLAIPLAGFGVGGVVAGSAAAAAQSALYGGATTGVFSVLQSTGATLAWVHVTAGGVGAVVAGAKILDDDRNE